MRFASFRSNGDEGVAIAAQDGIFHGLCRSEAGFPGMLDGLVQKGEAALRAAVPVLLAGRPLELDDIEFLPPLRCAGKVICIGLNYIEHANETKNEIPTYPAVFARFNSSLIGHKAAIIRPTVSDKLDYEGELAVIIGTAGRHIAEADALKHVLGYSIFNDASIRDFQRKSHQWTMGKNFDGTGAFGPYLVTADELPAGARGLKLETRLNGMVVQQASTDDLIFDVAKLVSLMSDAFRLEPGDLIVTGTPQGIGAARKPPLWMKAGDVCEVEVTGLGILQNSVADEASAESP